MAHRTFGGRHEIEQIFAVGIGSGGFEILFEVAENPEEPCLSLTLARALRLAVQQEILNLVGKFLEGRRQVETVGLDNQLDAANQVLRCRTGAQAAIEYRFRPIDNHLGRIQIVAASEAVALGTGSVGTVERERSRLQLRNADAAVGAGEARRIEGFVSVDDGDQDETAAEFHGQPDREFEAVFDSGLHQQAIHDDFDGVILALVEREVVLKVHQFAVDAGAGETVLDKLLHFFFEFAFAAASDGRHDHYAIVGRERHDALHDLLGRLARNRLAAIRAMGHADRRVEQAQVIVDLGDGADGGARTAAGGFLFDGDRGAEAVDRVDVGALHLVEKLARVGRKRFDVAPLAFGVNRIESERGFAGAAEPRNDRQGIARNFDVNILQVVLARAAHRDPGDGHLAQHIMDFRNVDGSQEMLESGNTQFDSRILVVNSGGGQMRIE